MIKKFLDKLMGKSTPGTSGGKPHFGKREEVPASVHGINPELVDRRAAEVVATLQKQIATAINQPAVKQKLIDFGIEPVGSTPQQYGDLIRTEVQRWHQLIREQKISLD